LFGGIVRSLRDCTVDHELLGFKGWQKSNGRYLTHGWRDTTDTVVIPSSDIKFIEIHFATKPGTAPEPYTAMLRVTARDGGGKVSTFVMMGGTKTKLAIMNQGNRRLQGEGTAEIYFAPEGSVDPNVPPLSNVLTVPIRFQ
jgi:hypothetical protein